MMIQLGSKVRDRVTGYDGIATSRTEFINGCVRYGVEGKIGADGKMPDAHYFDVQRLEVVDAGVTSTVQPDTARRPGGGANPPFTR